MMALATIAVWTGGRLLAGDAEVTGVAIDTRKLKPGDLFVAIRGELHGRRLMMRLPMVGCVRSSSISAGESGPTLLSSSGAIAVLPMSWHSAPSASVTISRWL